LGRLVEAIFGRQDELTGRLLEQNFAFDAEQFGGAPPVPALAVGRHRIVQGNESLVELACPGERQRESAPELRIPQAPAANASRSDAAPKCFLT
jgi:hypothetical protein